MGHVAYIILLAILLEYFWRIMRAPSGQMIRKSGFLVDKLPSDRELTRNPVKLTLEPLSR